jgi:NADPH:quinone reductase-like Zn-dependent oxidoreductase
MARMVTLKAPRQIAVEEYPEPAPGPGEVVLRTLYSGISAGTELTLYRGTNPHQNKRWDQERRLFVEGEAPDAYPFRPFGYEEVGEVAALGEGVTALQPGDLAWGSWGDCSHHRARQEWAAERLLPAGLNPLAGIYGHIGSIGLNAILDAAAAFELLDRRPAEALQVVLAF